MLKISHLNFSFHHKLIFDNLNFALSPKQKVVLIGSNGQGKSTLLRLILSQLQPDAGSISIDKKTSVGYLPQLTDLDIAIEDLVSASIQKHLFEKSLAKLGNLQINYRKLVSDYSGGEQIKLLMAIATASSPNLLLLDEPTNHLDQEARKWLTKFVQKFNGSIICVSHDRDFIDSFADNIYELHKYRLHKYQGSYSQYEEQKQQEIEGIQARNKSSLAKKKKLIENWKKRATRAKATIRKVPKDNDKMGFDYRAEKAMGAHVKALHQLERQIENTRAEDIDIPQSIILKNKAKQPDQCLLINWQNKIASNPAITINIESFKIYSRDRILISGPNGSGKSTVLDEIQQYCREEIGNKTVEMIDQHDPLAKKQQRVVEYFKTQTGVNEGVARGYLHRLLLSQDEATLPLNMLSPGQRLRLRFCTIIFNEPDLLLLDEPTNHLDINSVAVVQKLLQEHNKAFVLVSHDSALTKELKITKSYTTNNNELIEEYL